MKRKELSKVPFGKHSKKFRFTLKLRSQIPLYLSENENLLVRKLLFAVIFRKVVSTRVTVRGNFQKLVSTKSTVYLEAATPNTTKES